MGVDVFWGSVEVFQERGAEPGFVGGGGGGEDAGAEIAAGVGAEVGEVELVAGEGGGGEEEEEVVFWVGELEEGEGFFDEGVGAGDEGFFVKWLWCL